MGKLGYTADPIRDEREEADRIKREQKILAIIGNPPYWRFEGVNSREVGGPFIDDLWEDLKAPVRDAGWANQLNTFPEFSIAFWRWALWKMFEAENAPKKGVIAFISNRTFLAGKPYEGLRKMLRDRFDRIEIIDLRGDVRRGARAGVQGDAGVFNSMVGTAITLAIADGSKPEGAPAEVIYSDSWEKSLFAREAKLAWLEAGVKNGRVHGGVAVERRELDPLRPTPFGSVNWPSLEAIFGFYLSGLQTKRDNFSYALAKPALLRRLSVFKMSDAAEARAAFHDSRDRKWAAAHAQPIEESRITRVAYRPLDLRYLYNHPAFGDFLRPSLQRAWGDSNVGLYGMPFGTGAGPAVWCHAQLPDYHSFSGRGGYAFLLFDRRAGHGPLNFSPELIDNLALAYAATVEPQAVFDAILALLSATSYTLRFAEDLEDVFPHVPFPADRKLFERAAAIGTAIREVETFARAPDPAFLPPGLASFQTTPSGPLAAIGSGAWESGEITICENGSGKVIGLLAPVWDFALSGYRVLPRWLSARAGMEVDHAFMKEFRDINGRINELIHRFDEADLVLQEALNHSLTRDRLGLDPAGSGEDDGPD